MLSILDCTQFWHLEFNQILFLWIEHKLQSQIVMVIVTDWYFVSLIIYPIDSSTYDCL